jgi:hypothetical protein
MADSAVKPERKGPRMLTKDLLAVAIVVVASLLLTGDSRPAPLDEAGGLCCLCMCHSVDETKCAHDCVRMQHGTRVIEEPQMQACTKTCQRQGVKQIYFSDDGSSFVIVTPAAPIPKPSGGS